METLTAGTIYLLITSISYLAPDYMGGTKLPAPQEISVPFYSEEDCERNGEKFVERMTHTQDLLPGFDDLGDYGRKNEPVTIRATYVCIERLGVNELVVTSKPTMNIITRD